MIRVFLTDVDGVLTDAGMYYTESGDEFKKFNTHDGMAFTILRERGIKTGLITSEQTRIVENRAMKLKVDYLYQGVKHEGKLEAAKQICEREGITLRDVAYIGDDINCIPLLKAVGIAACPANAVRQVKDIPGIIELNIKGGDGAVRAFVDLLLAE
jgi:3-deoxy-D-manno-octulosonate 8-phosphate phosphatase (KDO 8-P phosphatase)